MKIMAFRDSISFAGPVCYESSSSLYEYFFSRAGRAAFCIQIVMYAVTPSPDCHVMTNTNDVSVARGRRERTRARRGPDPVAICSTRGRVRPDEVSVCAARRALPLLALFLPPFM